MSFDRDLELEQVEDQVRALVMAFNMAESIACTYIKYPPRNSDKYEFVIHVPVREDGPNEFGILIISVYPDYIQPSDANGFYIKFEPGATVYNSLQGTGCLFSFKEFKDVVYRLYEHMKREHERLGSAWY